MPEITYPYRFNMMNERKYNLATSFLFRNSDGRMGWDSGYAYYEFDEEGTMKARTNNEDKIIELSSEIKHEIFDGVRKINLEGEIKDD